MVSPDVTTTWAMEKQTPVAVDADHGDTETSRTPAVRTDEGIKRVFGSIGTAAVIHVGGGSVHESR